MWKSTGELEESGNLEIKHLAWFQKNTPFFVCLLYIAASYQHYCWMNEWTKKWINSCPILLSLSREEQFLGIGGMLAESNKVGKSWNK